MSDRYRKLLTGAELTIKQCACMRFVGRKNWAEMNAHAHQRIPYKGKIVRRPTQTEKGIAKQLERTLGLAQNSMSVVQAK